MNKKHLRRALNDALNPPAPTPRKDAAKNVTLATVRWTSRAVTLIGCIALIALIGFVSFDNAPDNPRQAVARDRAPRAVDYSTQDVPKTVPAKKRPTLARESLRVCKAMDKVREDPSALRKSRHDVFSRMHPGVTRQHPKRPAQDLRILVRRVCSENTKQIDMILRPGAYQ